MRKSALAVTIVGLALAAGIPVGAHAPSGAIFTTVFDGSEVKFNIYAAKEDVYLDGGPGIGAPQTAAGLDDGVYVFQVTDPPGKSLLSTDAAKCRRVTVAGGVITAVVVTGGCEHVTGSDIDHPPAKTVQLMPYLDTPNHGGEYKAWMVREEDYLLGCAEHGIDNGLDVVDCGWSGGNDHGFIPSHSKTDNFKVGRRSNLEIDTQFINDLTGVPIDGLQLTWVDTLGGSNKKWSYFKPEFRIDHFAHVEAVEAGTHKIVIADQPGCRVFEIHYKDIVVKGPAVMPITVKRNDREWTKFLIVYCIPD